MIRFSLFEKEDDEDQLIYEDDDWTFEDEEIKEVGVVISSLITVNILICLVVDFCKLLGKISWLTDVRRMRGWKRLFIKDQTNKLSKMNSLNIMSYLLNGILWLRSLANNENIYFGMKIILKNTSIIISESCFILNIMFK